MIWFKTVSQIIEDLHFGNTIYSCDVGFSALCSFGLIICIWELRSVIDTVNSQGLLNSEVVWLQVVFNLMMAVNPHISIIYGEMKYKVFYQEYGFSQLIIFQKGGFCSQW